MKLYMKQKVFSFKDKFTIKDENGNDKYFVEGEFLSLGKKLHISDAAGNECAFVKQKLISLRPRYFVYEGEREIAEIVKEITFLKHRYSVKGLGWSVNGNYLAHDYVVNDGSRDIVIISKQWMSWGDSYQLSIADDVDEVKAVAVVLAIDAAMQGNDNAGLGSVFS